MDERQTEKKILSDPRLSQDYGKAITQYLKKQGTSQSRDMAPKLSDNSSRFYSLEESPRIAGNGFRPIALKKEKKPVKINSK